MLYNSVSESFGIGPAGITNKDAMGCERAERIEPSDIPGAALRQGGRGADPRGRTRSKPAYDAARSPRRRTHERSVGPLDSRSTSQLDRCSAPAGAEIGKRAYLNS